MRLLLLVLFINPLYALTVSSTTTISGTGTDTNNQLSMAGNGQAVSIWTQNSPNQVEAAYFDGTSWGSPLIVADGTFSQVGISEVGTAIATWLDTSTSQVYVSHYSTTTSTWSTPVQLSTTGTFNANPQIAVNNSGNALAVWALAIPQSLLASSYTSAAGWSTPVTLVTGASSFAQVGLDNSNQGIVNWVNTQFNIDSVTVTIP